MPERREYQKRADQFVVAVQVDLETEGFTYSKWGADQRCKPGDWLLNNGGDIYTVDQEVFARTYREVGTGHYAKRTSIWAEVATAAGSMETKEGRSHYQAGDYVVSNNEDGSDAYCMTAAKFEEMYEPVD